MGKGYVRVTNKLIADALVFPPDWEVEKIEPSIYSGESIMLISGSDFPETNNRGIAEEVQLIVHEKARTFEIVKI